MLKILNKFEEIILGYTLLGIAILSFIQVVLRYIFHSSLTWSEEMIRYWGVFITFLGISLGVKYGSHFSMEALVQYLPDRSCHLLKALTYIISFITLIMLAYLGLIHSMKLMRFNVLSPATQIPMFLPYASIPIFSFIASLRFLNLFWASFKNYLEKKPFTKRFK